MRIYVASRYNLKEQASIAAQFFESEGHEIVSTWHDRPGRLQNLVGEGVKDVQDLHMAEILVLLGSGVGANGGCHVEFGFALANHYQLIVVDAQRGNIFQSLPGVYLVETLFDALPIIDSYGTKEDECVLCACVRYVVEPSTAIQNESVSYVEPQEEGNESSSV